MSTRVCHAVLSSILLVSCTRTAQTPPVAPRRADATIIALSTGGVGLAVGDSGRVSPTSAPAAIGGNVAIVSKGSQSFEAALINGLADFVVERAKAEVRGHLTKQLGNRLCSVDDLGWDMRSFFEETCSLMSGDNPELDTRDLGPVFRNALAKDLTRLLPIVLNSALEHTLASELAEHGAVVAAVLQAIDFARQEDDPAASIAIALRVRGMDCSRSGIACALHVIGLGLQALLTSRAGDEVGYQQIVGRACAQRLIEPDADHEPSIAPGSDCAVFLTEAAERLEELLTRAGDVEARRRLAELLPRRQRKPFLRALFIASLRAHRAVRKSYDRDEIVGASFELVDVGLRVLGTKQALEDFDRLRQVWYRKEEYAGVGRAVLAIIEGVWSGEDPAALLIAATTILPCSDSDDVGCALRAVSHAVAEVQRGLEQSELSCQQRGDDSALSQFVTVVDRRIAEAIRTPRASDGQGTSLRSWYDYHLGERIERRRELVLKITSGICNIRALMAEVESIPSYEAAKRRAMALALLDSTLGVWRGAMAAAVPGAKLKKALAILDNIHQARVAVSDGDIGAFLVSVRAVARHLDLRAPFPPAVEQYMPLMVELVSARSAADVTAALENFAEPAGGWLRKRQRGLSASLTAFLGLAGGMEVGGGTYGQFAGLAPIGIDVSHRTWGVLVSPIDLGALTSVRLCGQDIASSRLGLCEEAALPDIRLGTIFAPGFYARVSPWESPFVLGAGVSAIPGLRTGNDEDLAVRVLLFGGVDVTILSF